jgi:predicted RNA-binding Zn-ribbon protein involved in translation (DUF1610 family)
MITELLGAAQSVQSLFSLLKAAKGLANYNEIVAAVADINAKLMQANSVALSAQSEQSALASRVVSLEKQLSTYDNWERTAATYELKDVASGVYVYVSIKGVRHWACPKCFQERKRHVLQRQYPPCYKCPDCEMEIEPTKNGALVDPGDSC